MGKFYGGYGRIITFTHVCASFRFYSDWVVAVMALIVVICASIRGMQSVSITDVAQLLNYNQAKVGEFGLLVSHTSLMVFIQASHFAPLFSVCEWAHSGPGGGGPGPIPPLAKIYLSRCFAPAKTLWQASSHSRGEARSSFSSASLVTCGLKFAPNVIATASASAAASARTKRQTAHMYYFSAAFFLVISYRWA